MRSLHEGLPCRLLSRAHVLAMVPLSYVTIWQMIQQGEFPRAIVIGTQKVAWRENEILEWIASRPQQVLKADHSGAPKADGQRQRQRLVEAV